MKITNVAVKSFRLLAESRISLEETTTVIVGRNNCGKTSLTELFRRFLSDKSPSFRLEDFSLIAHDKFWKAFELKRGGAKDDVVRECLPYIELAVTVKYDATSPNVGALAKFIVDLNPDCTEALIVMRYQLQPGSIGALFADISVDSQKDAAAQKASVLREIRERVPKLFDATLEARDPNDPSNMRLVEWGHLRALLQGGFITAQRGMDDETSRGRNVLGPILEALFRTASSESASASDQLVAKKLEDAVKEIQASIGEGFNAQLLALLPTFETFGYPRFNDPALLTETTLDVERLLSDHTTVQYAGVDGINLPEAYNGLGTRNLIVILLKLLEFYKKFTSADLSPGLQLVFIEEPEVHLHPQMQEVFIAKLNEIASLFEKKFSHGTPWPVQFVVTTHSSHVANRASFDSIRYFTVVPSTENPRLGIADIRDLRVGLCGTPSQDREFLHKYLTLTKCDLFFADKVALIEGASERLLLPRMIELIEAASPSSARLSSQYVSVVEVGGAYAHLFFGLIELLGLRTLVITDIDAVKCAGGEGCVVSEGAATSNACIKAWFPSQSTSPADLLAMSAVQKTTGTRRIAYQVPEPDRQACGRSFEDAFILANLDLFSITATTATEQEASAQDLARRLGKKSDFALEYATERGGWRVPRYIEEGLSWLAENQPFEPAAPPVPVPVTPDPNA